MAAKFVIKKGPTGKFRFTLVATNGQVVATSEAYETKRACLNGVQSVRRIAAGAVLDDTTAVKPAAQLAATPPAGAAAKPAAPRAKPAAKKAPARKQGAPARRK